MKRTIPCLLLFALSAGAFCDVPVRTEQLIYSVVAYNGRDYAATFVRQPSETIWLIAGHDSFLSVRKTLVYYWPITEEWKLDVDNLNVPFEGTLELRDGTTTTVLGSERYTYFNVRGEYEFNWVVATGDAADAELKRWGKMISDYYDAAGSYQDKQAAHLAEANRLAEAIAEKRKTAEDVTALLERLRSLVPPEEPKMPSAYAAPPAAIQQAFILNLKPGEYAIRFLSPEGLVMEGSEKRVVVHERRRTDTTGYEVIPADKWTRPVESTTPSSVLYVNGETGLFLRPFFQDEYNDLAYERTLNNDARGNPSVMKWVRVQHVPRARIDVSRSGHGTVQVREAPYVVEQVTGAALGYRIVPYDPAGAHEDQEPSLIAFAIPLTPEDRVIRFRGFDAQGNALQGSRRQIRIVRPSSRAAVPIALASLPLLLMALVLLLRARRYRS